MRSPQGAVTLTSEPRPPQTLAALHRLRSAGNLGTGFYSTQLKTHLMCNKGAAAGSNQELVFEGAPGRETETKPHGGCRTPAALGIPTHLNTFMDSVPAF